MKNIVINLFILLLFCISCKENNRKIISSQNNTKDIKALKPYWLSIDSVKYDTTIKGYNLKSLNSFQRKNWTDMIFPLNKIKPLYNAYFYNLNHFKGIKHILVYVSADDYTGVFLINLKNNKLSDYFELSGGFCSGPYQDKKTGETLWCTDKKAFFVNDTTLIISELKSKSKSYDQEFPKTVDSLTYLLNIKITGKFKVTRKDSIRYVITK